MTEPQVILEWFARHGRDMPWRNTRNPYAIWIAEVVFQQTRISQGIGHYERFMERFPDVVTLAEASQDEVLKYWEGLGYYSRARNLHTAAKQLVHDFGREFPRSHTELLKLKGVGDYTSRAIASFAFEEPVGVLDGNIMRVLARYWAIEEPINTPAVRKYMQARLDAWAQTVSSRDLNHALMDLGSTICTPTKPGCLICPLVETCQARSLGLTQSLPLKIKSKRQPPRYAHFYLAFDARDRIAIRQRPPEGLWGGLWEVPYEDREEASWKRGEHREGFEFCFSLKHVFSHFDWHIKVFEGPATELPAHEGLSFIEIDKISTFAFARAVLRIFEQHPATASVVKSA